MASDGRRAAVALAIIVPAPSIGALAAFWIAPGAVGQTLYAVGKGVLYLTPLVWLLAVERSRLGWSRPRKGSGANFLIGAATGVAIGGAILALWRVLGPNAIDIESIRELLAANGLATPGKYLAAAVWLSLVNSALEEYSFRWFITSRWERIAPALATWLSAACFALHHFVVLTAYLPLLVATLATGGVFAGGVIWSWLYRRSGTIWPGWLSHVIVDAAIMWIGWSVLFA